LRVISAIPKLSDALRDEQWWVRFRAAGALAALGDYGRIALEEAIGADDPYARDMAISIGSLSEANRLEQSG
jgi:HEAT repeat protein